MTVRLAVLADTHVRRPGRWIPPALYQELNSADLVVHLGDFTEPEVARELETFAPLVAVHGNNDSWEVCERYPALHRLEIEGHEFVLIHGHVGGRTALEAARGIAGGDAILFGHSHQPVCRREGGRLLFNPGSPTDKRWSPHRAFGVIEVAGRIDARVVELP